MSLIEVIVPCYNYGRFLRECVESVLNQSYRELRVVIVDDASTDETPSVCAELTGRDSRVALRRHPVNFGHIQTYNEAIELARGDYMLLLSADDFLLPGALRRAVAALDAAPKVGLAWGPAVFFHAGDVLPSAALNTVNAAASVLDGSAFVRRLLALNIVPHSAAVVRTSEQKRLGGYLETLPHAGDLEMWLRYAIFSKVARIHASQVVQRIHDSNMSLAYRGFADFEQCRDSFRAHYGNIREHLSNGATHEKIVRRRFAMLSLHWAKAARNEGNDDLCRKLLAEALDELP